MKILKKAEQRNFIVNSYYYNEYQLEKIIAKGIAEKFDFSDDETLHLYATFVKEVKVVLDEYGYYTNVAVTHDGEIIYIEL